jgi:multiple sugar transport system permease protein
MASTETTAPPQPSPGRAPAPRNPAAPVARRRLDRWRRDRFPYALIAPAVVVMVLIHLLPTAGGVVLSFKNLNTFTFAQLFGAPWNGIENYRSILFDSSNPLHNGFFNAVSNTAVYAATTVAGALVGGMLIALLLNREFPGQRIVRTLMLAPWVVPSFVVATLWQFMWQSDVGIINKILVDYLHIVHDRPVWLLGPNTMWAMVIPSIWRTLPFVMLIFLAGLQAIPRELHEAAAIDGAGPIRRFVFITLPLLRPLIAVQLLIQVIYACYQFAIPWIMFGSNPGENADLMMTLIVRQSFSNNLFGFGAAASVLLMFAMTLWVLVWFVGFRRDLRAATS